MPDVRRNYRRGGKTARGDLCFFFHRRVKRLRGYKITARGNNGFFFSRHVRRRADCRHHHCDTYCETNKPSENFFQNNPSHLKILHIYKAKQQQHF